MSLCGTACSQDDSHFLLVIDLDGFWIQSFGEIDEIEIIVKSNFWLFKCSKFLDFDELSCLCKKLFFYPENIHVYVKECFSSYEDPSSLISPKMSLASHNPPICVRGWIIFCPHGTLPFCAINDAENVQY